MRNKIIISVVRREQLIKSLFQ